MMPQEFCVRVNREWRSIEAYPMERLLDVLREQLNLPGTKEGCGEGECGACSVLVDGQLVNSCLIPIGQVNGTEIVTIEGIGDGGRLAAVQQAFLECGGAQCGMCTPGMIMASVHLLRKCSRPNLEQIQEALNGNLCRCTGYIRIFEAVSRAAELEAHP